MRRVASRGVDISCRVSKMVSRMRLACRSVALFFAFATCLRSRGRAQVWCGVGGGVVVWCGSERDEETKHK